MSYVKFKIEMDKTIKYGFLVQSTFHLENFLSYNNQTNDSYFWLDEKDHGGREFYFSSTILNELENFEEIFKVGTQIISIYQGIYTLLDRNRNYMNYFILKELTDIDSNRTLCRNTNPEIYKIDIDFTKLSYSEENKPTNSIYILFEKIIQDEFLTNLFFLLSNKVDYRMLYIIFDDIRYYLKRQGDHTFIKEFVEDLKRFTHTANNYEVLGFFARHGRSNLDPPKMPMNLEDSKNLIFDIIVKLIDEKFGIKLPEFWGFAYVDFSNIDLTTLFEK